MPRLPDFLIIGAPKAGTTTLWHLLRQHPGIYMPDEKEPAFFSQRYDRGWEWYLSLFHPAGDHQKSGEATPEYSAVERYPQAPEHIARCLPQTRLIYIVRNPLERAVSSYLQSVHRNRLPPGRFNEAARQYRPILETSLYWRNIQAYRRHFADEQIKILFLEDLQRDLGAVLQNCFRFLGVDSSFSPASRSAKNVASNRRRPAAIVKRLQGNKLLRAGVSYVPGGVRRLGHIILKHRLLHRPLHQRPSWDASTRSWFADQIRNDAQSLLQYAGKPVDFWEL